jgi:hypothetical protein
MSSTFSIQPIILRGRFDRSGGLGHQSSDASKKRTQGSPTTLALYNLSIVFWSSCGR